MAAIWVLELRTTEPLKLTGPFVIPSPYAPVVNGKIVLEPFPGTVMFALY